MKKSSLRFTLLILFIPIILTLLSYYFLDKIKYSTNQNYFIFISDFIILFVSGVITYFLILKNYKQKQTVLEKINQNNEAIRLSNERYDIVAKATSDTIWDWQLTDNSFIWNKGIQGIFGYKKNDVVNTLDWWLSKVHPDDRDKLSVNLFSIIENRTERWQGQYRFECADKTFKYILDRGFLTLNFDGSPNRMIGAMQDITKQKLEEERLKLLETVIMKTKDAVIITEINQTENEIPKITYVNPAFTSITGYKSKEVIGKPSNSFLDKETITREIKKISAALKSKNEINFESLNTRKSGENYWVNFSMIPINNSDGKHSHWISIQREITEEKKREKEKEQLIRELIQNNSDLKQFSYITSHNLRAPLSNLTGLLYLLDDVEVNDLELIEIIKGFKISTNLLNETVNDLIKVLIIKDSPCVSEQNIDILEVVNNIQTQIQTLINKSQPKFVLNLDALSHLNTNKTYFESILLNLITNSIKYRSETIPLQITITSSETSTHYQIIFKDNGIGIDLERNKDKIFGLYQRFHDYPDSKGLGLYLVKSQIESMNGSIDVKSEVNKGTQFKITLQK